MECIGICIGQQDSFYVLFYEELDQEDLSRIYHFSGRTNTRVRLVAEIQEWVVSIWANQTGKLYAATWDGQILSIGDTVQTVASPDLICTTMLTGFAAEPQFIMGEDGEIFENRRGKWRQIAFRGKWRQIAFRSEQVIYSIARRKTDTYVLTGSSGWVVTYRKRVAVAEKLPTHMDLFGIAFSSPDKGVVVGDEGTAFQYQSGTWVNISINKPKSCLQDVHFFKGRFLVSVEGESIDEITDDGTFVQLYDHPGYCFSSNEAFCVTFNDNAALVFDGTQWTAVPFSGLLDFPITQSIDNLQT